ncbi:MAG TPA: WecB/TagA/CpsF family glycosyltransferase [Dehalococcoidia bacterium]|nr:WecB/TagA/CpsF family glycosyltransferase [Dehalococcoidia bacterium]
MTINQAAEIVSRAVDSRQKMRAVFCTAHMIIDSQSNPHLKAAVNSSGIVATDGMPLVWLSRLKGAQSIERVYGPDAMLAFAEHGLQQGWRHFFYGGTPKSAEALQTRLQSKFPGLVVAGTYAPPFRPLTEDEKQDIVDQINRTKPDLIWVGLGMPKQELWSAEFQARLDAPVILAVGAAFDFHAGVIRQAPYWMQRSGTEWLFRLVQEPRRLWRRYLLGNSRFLWLLVKEWLHRPKAPYETLEGDSRAA